MAVRTLTAVLFLAAILPGQTAAVAPASAVTAVETFVAESRAPGVSIAVLVEGEVWTHAAGLADVENEVPVIPETVFRLASISKPITATIALRLAARGELDLDASVDTLVPEWPKKPWPVTTRQLLGHLGGVRHYKGRESLQNVHYETVAGGLVMFADDPLLHEPGTRYRYTTYGYNLAGAACVAAAGRSFRDLLRDEVVVPAGCETLQFDDSDRLIPRRAQGYRLRDDEILNAAPVDTSNKVPGGGMCSTARDLVLFAEALLDGRLLDDASREAMWTEQRTKAGEGTGYGLGFGVGERDGRRIVTHTGAQPRVSTILTIDVERGVAVAVLCNLEGQGRRLRRLAAELADGALPR